MIKDVRNLFVETDEAVRYDSFRPHYHDLPFAKLAEFFAEKISRALDVACGTGHSTRSLSKIAVHVTGCDLSEGMLMEAHKRSSHDYVMAPAEQLPFDSSAFDYVHTSMAFQWFDQRRFLAEARRVLIDTGHLGIDNYGFTGKMTDAPRFQAAYKDFDKLYMKPVRRNPNFPEDAIAQEFGLRFVRELRYDHPVEMTCEQFTNYLMTRSNFLELSPAGRLDVSNKLTDYYAEFFGGSKRTLAFAGMLKLYQAIA